MLLALIPAIAALLMEPIPVPTSELEPPDTYTVAVGDNLTVIAEDHELLGWRRLFDSNPEIKIPDLIYPGQEILIPDPDDEFKVRALPAPPPPPAPVPEPTAKTRQDQPRPPQSVPPTPPVPNGGSAWDQLAQCESGGNPRAVNPSGKYRGAYQFDRQTWASVGGSGDPAESSYEEQQSRAKQLQAQRGWSPWPQCSRKLGLR